MSSKFRLSCFDMDGTIIRNIDSVRYLCQLNGMGEQCISIEQLEEDGRYSWVEADYLKAQLIKGLPVIEIERRFDEKVHLISGVGDVV